MKIIYVLVDLTHNEKLQLSNKVGTSLTGLLAHRLEQDLDVLPKNNDVITYLFPLGQSIELRVVGDAWNAKGFMRNDGVLVSDATLCSVMYKEE